MSKKNKPEVVKKFSYKWNGHGDEKQETQKFWLALLRDIFEIENPEDFIDFEYPVEFDGKHHNIDAMIKSTGVLIEQKSFGVDLSKKYQQSDGIFLTPYEQAKRYADNLPQNFRPRFIIVCNFAEFQIYDLEEPFLYYIVEVLKSFDGKNVQTATDFNNEANKNILRYKELEKTKFKPITIELKNFIDSYKRLSFLVDANAEHLLPEMQVSTAAAKGLKKLYEFFEAEYEKNYPKENYLDALNSLAVRLLYCFYASDAHIFDGENSLQEYLQSFPLEKRHQALSELFSALDSEKKSHGEKFENFPYINGGLFEKKFPIPPFTDKTFFLTTMQANENILGDYKRFNWRTINPTIFGAMFESILEREEDFYSDFQRNHGIYYTSKKNIHKLIDELFFTDLLEEFKNIVSPRKKNKIQNLKNFQIKLSQLKFLDPACGSGNFLTETYLSLRELENKVIQEIKNLGGELEHNPIKVSVGQFFGIEIFSFGVEVTKTALWIAEHQTLRETEGIVGHDIEGYLPLTDYKNIFNENSLQIHWSRIVPKDELNYIIGNPPFVGKSFRNEWQKFDMDTIFENVKGHGNLDYVACWFKKTADFIKNTKIRAAFLATNSVCQGVAVPPLWDYLFAEKFHIDFAFRTFKWQNSLEKSAAVHCVIVAFSHAKNNKPKKIFTDEKNFIVAEKISPYLTDETADIVKPRKKSFFDVPPMFVGSCPADGGNFIFSDGEYNYFIEKFPDAKKFFKMYIGADEFLNGKKRFCLWLKDFSIEEIKKFPKIYERVEAVKNFRLASKKIPTRKKAETPTLFTEDRFINSPAIFIPMLSSCNRKYIPIGFIDADIVVNNLASFIPNGNLYLLGILISKVLMEWLKISGSRFKSDYRFSPSLVYNTFPFPSPSEEQRKKIEQTAEKILSVRKSFYGWTLAMLYDEKKMPYELRAAHEENDLAVLAAYGFDEKISESEIVAELMNLYKSLTESE